MDALLGYHGFLVQFGPVWLMTVTTIFVLLFVGFFNSPLFVWAIVTIAALFGLGFSTTTLTVVAALFVFFLIKPLRTLLVSKGIMYVFEKAKFVPQISQTERTALEAGVVWVEKDLFSGKPNLQIFLKSLMQN